MQEIRFSSADYRQAFKPIGTLQTFDESEFDSRVEKASGITHAFPDGTEFIIPSINQCEIRFGKPDNFDEPVCYILLWVNTQPSLTSEFTPRFVALGTFTKLQYFIAKKVDGKPIEVRPTETLCDMVTNQTTNLKQFASISDKELGVAPQNSGSFIDTYLKLQKDIYSLFVTAANCRFKLKHGKKLWTNVYNKELAVTQKPQRVYAWIDAPQEIKVATADQVATIKNNSKMDIEKRVQMLETATQPTTRTTTRKKRNS